ncbi:MAG: VanW family protein [Roseburia sp.]
MPGEEYSANAPMEPYTTENGFTEAGSYENGKATEYGWWNCQISTTLYNAVSLRNWR